MVPHSPPKVHKTYTKTTPRKRIGISVSRKNPIPLKITKDEKKPDPYIEHFRQEIQSSNFDSQLTKDTFKEGFAQARNKYVNVHHTTPSIYPLVSLIFFNFQERSCSTSFKIKKTRTKEGIYRYR